MTLRPRISVQLQHPRTSNQQVKGLPKPRIQNLVLSQVKPATWPIDREYLIARASAAACSEFKDHGALMTRHRLGVKRSRSAPSQPPREPQKASEAASGRAQDQARESRNRNHEKSKLDQATKRLGRWTTPILAAALTAALTTALTAAFTNLPGRLYGLVINSGRDSSHVVSPPPVAAAVTTGAVPCRSGWVVPDRGQRQIPYSRGTPEKQPVNAVLSSGGNVTITVQGVTGQTVVLQSLTVEVVNRSSPAAGIYLPVGCQESLTPRYYVVNLDSPTPRVVPQPGSISFPYRVTSDDPEQFVITPEVAAGDVQWLLYLNWTSGAKAGRLTIENSRKPFQTAGIAAARHFCNDFTGWKSSC